MGGVTAVFEMPNTDPLTVTEADFTDKVKRGRHRMHCDFAFFIGGTRENVQDLPELERAQGCAGVKVSSARPPARYWSRTTRACGGFSR